MPKIKRRDEEALLAKAAAVFAERQKVFTGQGLTRRELRKLEGMGIVEKRLMNTGTGSMLLVWGMVRSPTVEPADKVHASIDRPWPEKIKQGIMYRLNRKVSKNKYAEGVK